MIHLIYKTTHIESGRYYIGRHSTTNVNDGYIGSGKWVRSILNKDSLRTDILFYCKSFNELLIEEQLLISNVINDPLNMNFNKSSIGFSTGELNPSNTIEGKLRLSENNWMKTDEGKKYASENNLSKLSKVKAKRREFALTQLENNTHNFQKKESIDKKRVVSRERFLSNNPAKTEEHKQLMKKQLKEGTHPFQIVVTCPHCNKTGVKSNMVRYHFDNCKIFTKNINL